MEKTRATAMTRLLMARITGAAALALLGQLAVDFPEGYFGRIDEITDFGALYAMGFGLASVLLLLAVIFRWRFATPLSFLLYSSNLGVFAPSIVSDPVTAGMIVLWHLALIVWGLFPPDLSPKTAFASNGVSQPERWLAANGPAAIHLSLLSLVATTAIVGYRLSTGLVAHVTCIALNLLAASFTAQFVYLEIRSGRRVALAAYLPLLLASILIGSPQISLAILVLYQVTVLLLMASRGAIIAELSDFLLRRTALLTILTFVVLSLVGTLLLTFPAASGTGVSIAPLDALFTSTSATCVTGLIVLDTPRDLSLFGQAIVLGLIQVGGLGIIVLSTFATLLLGGHLGLRHGQSMAALLEIKGPRSAHRLTVFIVTSTMLIETVGAILLLPPFLGRGMPLGEALFKAVFHSISAFCNAGFALQSDSLVAFQRDPYVLGVIMALIILGGLGFLVIAASWWRISGLDIGTFRIHIRAAVWTSLALTLLGFAVITSVEWNSVLSSLPMPHRLTNGLFQSVTLRTAGFNSVDLTRLKPATVLVMQLLMFIGASPGGTGGGIKTTTLLVLLAGAFSISRGQSRVTLMRRTIPETIMLRAGAVALMALGVAFTGFFILLVTQQQPFEKLGFEVVSAIGTVGLSIGNTGALSPVGKLVITLLMLVGRVGPLTVALVVGHPRESQVAHAETQIMVG